ncbi:helix-turn-helix transcriptional regulator [Rhodococcus sp. 4CII]|uniref:AraC family transcriptional regulator n=1 Tax=Rhodococcus sp. 4CII TaxID=2834580 RepID=UPI00289A9A5C|nr:helix-turn-helix transcriptional regulator [Rhodococcus sp. 4CII]
MIQDRHGLVAWRSVNREVDYIARELFRHPVERRVSRGWHAAPRLGRGAPCSIRRQLSARAHAADRVQSHCSSQGFRVASRPLHIVRINWGADVAVHSEHPGAVGINIPLHGERETRIRGRLVVSTRGFATVNPADTPADITRWPRACTIVGVKIDRDFAQRELWRVTGRADAVIPDQIDLRRPAAAAPAGGFRLYLGKTPRECLTEIRLAGVRAELASGSARSVTDVALKWGFTHFGRFAAAFRQRYGVSPSSLLH